MIFNYNDYGEYFNLVTRIDFISKYLLLKEFVTEMIIHLEIRLKFLNVPK